VESTAPPPEAPEESGVSLAFSDRVRLYLKVTTLINVMLMVVAVSMMVFGVTPRHGTFTGQLVTMVLASGANAMAWMAIARSKHSVRTAIVTEAIATVALAAAYAVVTVWLNPDAHRADVILVILLITLVLVLRASLIPSPVGATVVIGLLSIGVGVGVTIARLPDLPLFARLWSTVLGIVVVVVTTVTTYTVYGLQRRMEVAKRLGQYQLERRVGRGGMGEVYLAKHSLLHRPTAIKLLRDVTSATARARFRQEVQTASGLTHPNTIEIYDYGRTADGVFYFAMEYVEGASLLDIVDATGGMPAPRVARLLEQAASSLREAHGRGLVHRDIKPSNLMICERGGDFDTLKVLDFGLVRDVSHDEEERSDALTGTPLYMAPEAILDANGFAPESDVYALGATAFFMLTGRPPFCEGGLVDVLADHLSAPPRRPESSDPELADLVLRALSKDPADRPSDGGAFLEGLRSCPSFGRWSTEDARVWWEEHRELVDTAKQAEAGSVVSDERFIARRTGPSTTDTSHPAS